MNIGVIGVGSIGGTIAAGYRELGHTVYENDLDDDRPKRPIDKAAMGEVCDIVFITVPTPTTDEGCDLNAVQAAIEGLDAPDATVVIRSTVAPGTTTRLSEVYDLPLVHMPEMLRDRGDVDEFLNPDRLVIAGPEPERQWVVALHNDLETTVFEFDDPTVAELAKYAHNAMWATKVSFANQMRLFAEYLNVDPVPVMEVVAADRRNTGSHLDPTLGPYAGRCLVEGTMVATPEGYIPIEDVELGMSILDDEGVTEVTAKKARRVPRTIRVNARGHVIEGSEDHIHFVWNDDRGERDTKRLSEITDEDWIIIPEIGGEVPDTVVLGEPPNGYIDWWPAYYELNQNMGWIIGMYLAEGFTSIHKDSRISEVRWTLGGHEEVLAETLCDRLDEEGFNPYKRKRTAEHATFGPSTTWTVRVRSQGLVELLNLLGIGTGAHQKRSPPFSDEIAKKVIGGWLDGDGSYTEGTIEGYSKSTDLIQSIDRMLLRLGICGSIDSNGERIRISTRDEVERISNWSESYEFDEERYVRDNSYNSPTCKRIDGGWAAKVRRVEVDDSPKQVVAIDTDSQRYIAENALTHNCVPKDLGVLRYIADAEGVEAPLFEGVHEINELTKDQFNGDTATEDMATSGLEVDQP